MARRPRFTIEQIEEALRQSAGIRSGAAAKLGCTPTTVSNYIARSKRLQKVAEEIVEETLDLAEGVLIKAISDNNLTATIFYLKTKGKARGYTERAELTGKEGGPVEFTDLATFLSQGFDAGESDQGPPALAGPRHVREGRVPDPDVEPPG